MLVNVDGGNIMVDQVPPIGRFYSGVNEELCDLKQSYHKDTGQKEWE